MRPRTTLAVLLAALVVTGCSSTSEQVREAAGPSESTAAAMDEPDEADTSADAPADTSDDSADDPSEDASPGLVGAILGTEVCTTNLTDRTVMLTTLEGPVKALATDQQHCAWHRGDGITEGKDLDQRLTHEDSGTEVWFWADNPLIGKPELAFYLVNPVTRQSRDCFEDLWSWSSSYGFKEGEARFVDNGVFEFRIARLIDSRNLKKFVIRVHDSTKPTSDGMAKPVTTGRGC